MILDEKNRDIFCRFSFHSLYSMLPSVSIVPALSFLSEAPWLPLPPLFRPPPPYRLARAIPFPETRSSLPTFLIPISISILFSVQSSRFSRSRQLISPSHRYHRSWLISVPTPRSFPPYCRRRISDPLAAFFFIPFFLHRERYERFFCRRNDTRVDAVGLRFIKHHEAPTIFCTKNFESTDLCTWVEVFKVVKI